MTFLEMFLGVALGGLAALLQLAATWKRAVLTARGGAGLALSTLPVSIVVPTSCLAIAILWSSLMTLSSLVGFWLIRTGLLALVVRFR